jgi:predicted TIM-barrel fold metal-dependent hydrolase
MTQIIIDTHLHLDANKYSNPSKAAAALDQDRQAAGIAHCIVLHLLSQNWSKEEFADALSNYPSLHGFVNIHPDHSNCLNDLEQAVKGLLFCGLKLHPRLQKFSVNNEATKMLVRKAGDLGVPVLIDAFPDGTHLMQGFDALSYGELAKSCPDTKIIIAHMGGHHVLDFVMLAKRIPNLYFDVSYSFLYYRGSSVISDMVYGMKSMKFDRVFYGSDYPDRGLKDTLDQSILIFDQHAVSEADKSKILYQNASKFFGLN